MKRFPEFIILALWLISIATTFFIVGETRLFTYLGPLYFICMMGSIVAVRNARK